MSDDDAYEFRMGAILELHLAEPKQQSVEAPVHCACGDVYLSPITLSYEDSAHRVHDRDWCTGAPLPRSAEEG